MKYPHSNKKVKIYCNKCKNIFYQTPENHLQLQGCPNCSNKVSKTEIEIKKLVFNITKLKFEQTVYLPELQGLELDMYNKHHNLAIEYNGEQHYPRYRKNWSYFKIKSILNTQKRDRKKKYLCRKYGITLIIIPCYQWSSLKTTMEKRKYLKEKVYGITR